MDELDSSNDYPELLADLAAQVATCLVDKGMAKDQAAEIGMQISEHVRSHWSGQPIYIPKGTAYEFSKRDMEIYERFNGRNHTALAREYNRSVMRIYQIVKAVRAEVIKKRQGALF